MSYFDRNTEDLVKYQLELRQELLNIGITRERLRRLDDLPLTPKQVARAIQKYVIEIEKRERNKRLNAKVTGPK